MLQQTTIPKTAEETAARLARLNRENRRFVESAIAVLIIRQGMDEQLRPEPSAPAEK